MENSPLLIDRLRLDCMFSQRQSFQADKKKNTILTKHRFQSVDTWSEERKKEANKIFAETSTKTSTFDDKDDFKDSFQVFSDHSVNLAAEDSTFQHNQIQSLQNLFQTNRVTSNATSSNAHTTNSQPLLMVNPPQHMPGNIERTASLIKETKFSSEILDEDTHNAHQQTNNNVHLHDQPSGNDASAYIESKKLSQTQQDVTLKFHDYFQRVSVENLRCDHQTKWQTLHNSGIEAPKCLINGDPGTGKSYTITTISELTSIMSIGTNISTSFNGIAAVQVDGGTVSSKFKTHNSNPFLSDDELKNMCADLDIEHACLLIVDEVSTLSTREIALIHLRLQQAMNNDLDFGGLPVLFVGDYNQLDGVKKDPTPKSMQAWARQQHNRKKLPHEQQQQPQTKQMSISDRLLHNQHLVTKLLNPTLKQKKNKEPSPPSLHSLTALGCNLLARFTRVHLTEMQRSKDDPIHNAFLKKLSNGTNLSIKDLQEYKPLTKKDLAAEPDEWKHAPILTATNDERINLTKEKCILWAKEHNTHVFRWRCKTSNWKNKPPPEHQHTIENENNFFWQFWVPNTSSYLTLNVNTSLALVNGAPTTTHSLTFTDHQELERIQSLINGPNMKPFGSIITIEQPASVNLRVNVTLDGKAISTKRQQQLLQLKKISLPIDNTIHFATDQPSPSSAKTTISPVDDSQQISADTIIIIPVTPEMCTHDRGNNKWRNCTFKCSFDCITKIGKVNILEPIPFELGFAMTIHKAQGRTLQRIIIDLTDRKTFYSKMKLAAVYVAFSRVKNRHHIRLLEYQTPGKQHNRHLAYSQFTKLKCPPAVSFFFQAFTTPETAPFHTWNPQPHLTKKQVHF